MTERILIIIGINELIVTTLGLLLDRRLCRDWRMHALLVGSALLAALSPEIAAASSIAGMPRIATFVLAPLFAGASQCGLWAETFLMTGIVLDALQNRRPVWVLGSRHWLSGLKKGAIFSAVFMLAIHGAALVRSLVIFGWLWQNHPWLCGALSGVIAYPFARTIIESFDGSSPFARRFVQNMLHPMCYVRGAFVGGALAIAITLDVSHRASWPRFTFGLIAGVLAYGGGDIVRDVFAIVRGPRTRLQTWRVYALDSLLGAFVGGALAWYLDAAQLDVITQKFVKYAAMHFSDAGQRVENYVIYPLFSKWGRTNLGSVDGGVRLLFCESWSGVINWSLAAPLFSINLILLHALFRRSFAPVKAIATRDGVIGLGKELIRVLRWGLWMAPVIYSFLRMSPDPAWYNQDGAVRTITSTVKSWTLTPDAFHAWSLEVFLGLLAYNWLRILIWFDHMGLRVATLVNLSFVGGDALDERAARFLGHPMRTRCIPEGIRRFATWAPLLIPFYIPRGADWDQVWSGAERVNNAHAPMLPAVASLLGAYGAALGAALVVLGFFLFRKGRSRNDAASGIRPECPLSITNGVLTVERNASGALQSRALREVGSADEIDLTQHSGDLLRPRGHVLFIRDVAESKPAVMPWSASAKATKVSPTSLKLAGGSSGIEAEATVTLDSVDAVEVCCLRIKNTSGAPRTLEVTSLLELALNLRDACLRQPAFNSLHVGTCFVRKLGAIMAQNRLLKHSHHDPAKRRVTGETFFHAVSADGNGTTLLGYEDSRANCIGTGTLFQPGCLTQEIRSLNDEGLLHTADPVASLRVKVELAAGATAEIRFAGGFAPGREGAARLISKHLGRPVLPAEELNAVFHRPRELRETVAEDSAFSFSDDGSELRMGPLTSRPWHHLIANELGHGAVVGNDGTIVSFARNSQKNAITPFITDTVPAQKLGQMIYVLNEATGEIDTPAFAPHRRADARHEIVFGRGYAVFRKSRAGLELEMTAFVPPDAPVEWRLLTIRNRSAAPMRLRVVPYFEIVLDEIPEDVKSLEVNEAHAADGALFFRNPDNAYVHGWAFVSTDLAVASHETKRAKLFGEARDPLAPDFVLQGASSASDADDGRRIAAFAGTIEVAAQSEAVVSIALGFAASLDEAVGLSRVHRGAKNAQAALLATKQFWQQTLSPLRVETSDPAFDRLVNDWLPHQVLVSRLWARTGPEQRSGAFGFRDQLQDVLPLAATHPEIARKRILLHAAQQFPEGDVLAWWHAAPEGGTGLGARNKASDLPLWLPFVVAEYVAASGDRAVLDEHVPFLEGKAVAAGEEGYVFVPRQSLETATLREHCRRGIDWVLRRKGSHNLPLLRCGDWNDGLNAAGIHDRGESVWLGFFMHAVLVRFGPLGDDDQRRRYEAEAGELREALDRMWRGERYVRVVHDSGAEMIFADALTAAWPAISGATDFERSRAAVENALRVLEKDRMVLLLDPPFTESSDPYPGRIADYPPGVRENGGQYSHGVSWLVDALARLADTAAEKGDAAESQRLRRRAVEIWCKISSLDDLDHLRRLGLPPHQQAADVASGPGIEGRGGWSWYTGAAARMLSAAYAMLGIRFENGRLRVAQGAFDEGGALKLKRVTFRGKSSGPEAG